MQTCVLFGPYRLCESKQSKVFLPEHPFPHAEVSIYENEADMQHIQ